LFNGTLISEESLTLSEKDNMQNQLKFMNSFSEDKLYLEEMARKNLQELQSMAISPTFKANGHKFGSQEESVNDSYNNLNFIKGSQDRTSIPLRSSKNAIKFSENDEYEDSDQESKKLPFDDTIS
jgi:hypothetical protein